MRYKRIMQRNEMRSEMRILIINAMNNSGVDGSKKESAAVS